MSSDMYIGLGSTLLVARKVLLLPRPYTFFNLLVHLLRLTGFCILALCDHHVQCQLKDSVHLIAPITLWRLWD